MTPEEAAELVERMRTPLDMNQLWCVHVIGLETVIAQPSRLMAEARAKLWQVAIDQRYIQDPNKYDPVIYCTVEPWEGTPKLHAVDLASHNGEPEDIC